MGTDGQAGRATGMGRTRVRQSDGKTGTDGRVGRLDADVEAAIVRAYEAWDGQTPRLDDFLADFDISKPTLYAVLRRNGRQTKRELLVQARRRARMLDPDPTADGKRSSRAADGVGRSEAEARRWENEARRLRALLLEHGIDPDVTA